MTTTDTPSADLLRPRSPRPARAEAGRARRESVPLDAHAELPGRGDRPDALAILHAQDVDRLANLLPIRYGRMVASPFAFLRGSAGVMAADLAESPRTDITVQLGGDSHVANFGGFAAPDRRLVFDANDFDETLPGPFEWDVKRLTASALVAARHIGLGPKRARAVAAEAAAGYRTAITTAAERDPLFVWYFRVEVEQLMTTLGARKEALKKLHTRAAKKNQLGALAKLTDIVDGRRVIVDRPPLIVHPAPDVYEEDQFRVRAFLDQYRESLAPERRWLLDHYALVDVARKVVGVGSVGTRCLIALFESGDGDPLFLQVKEATSSVLEGPLGASSYATHGERVVRGQRIVQSAGDEFLGWGQFAPRDHAPVDFYVRQLWDGKISANLEALDETAISRYSRVCGAVLARAHARSGDAAMIAGYLGDDDTFDRALVAFAEAAADRNAVDHAQLLGAIENGTIEAVRDI
jgi:uncharacterized protein (DUF2252 family)